MNDYTNYTEEELQAAFIGEMLGETNRKVILETELTSLFTVCAALQLALRHPSLEEHTQTADIIRGFLRHAYSMAAPEGTARGEVARRGFLKQYDMEVDP